MKDDHRKAGEPFSSNAERLSINEWIGLLLVLVFLGVFAGPAWERLEEFELSTDYRIPYNLSEDYWLFDRYCGDAAESEKTFVIGDSFVWGQYVKRGETLSHFLNEQAESERFVNAGMDGTHPLALGGLIKHYCAGLRDREVILHLNLLWVSSPQADLQLARGVPFNHPRLVPQFAPTIPGYGAPVSEKLGNVLARYLPVLDWSRHIQSVYYSNADLPHWTLDNPNLNPLRQITLDLPQGEDHPAETAQAWFVEGGIQQELPWVQLETSLQWGAFQRLAEILRGRGNRVFVLVGPLNEHMLVSSSLAVYRGILGDVESWLNDHDYPHHIPSVLPSDLYADMSHPLSQGYALLAQDLWAQLSG